MICRAVWTGSALDCLVWAQGIDDVSVDRVECWHSEWEDVGSPWTEWRILDVQGKCRVRWRVREGVDPLEGCHGERSESAMLG